MKALDKVILFVLAAIFLFSGIDKMVHYEGFMNALRNYVLVPKGSASLLATPLIIIELMIGLGLMIRPWRASAALTAALTLAVFSAAIGLNYFYGGRGICGCWFTITLANSTGMHIAQNLLLLALALTVWWEARPAAPRGARLDTVAAAG